MKTLGSGHTVVYVVLAITCFHTAYLYPPFSLLILGYLFALVQLARARSARWAFYSGLTVGLLTFGPQLDCFWRIFGPAAIDLWLILAFWTGLFVALARLVQLSFRPALAAAVLPFLWTGLEYFRSELYYLRFSWLTPGYALSPNLPHQAIGVLGVYGMGFAAVALVVTLSIPRPLRLRLAAFTVVGCLLGAVAWIALRLREPSPEVSDRTVEVAGVQLEFPNEPMILNALNGLLKRDPGAELILLGEYTLDGPVPDGLRLWCRDHRRYLVVGGKDPLEDGNYYDTAFVVGPTGEILFRQAKSVPIQFFKDGRPAARQRLWNSPWGEIGICICYDVSYVRVTDRLVRLGAQALLVPSMDLSDWGGYEHRLHARVAPVRAAEYGIPIFRVASSGVSQLVESSGCVSDEAPFPGELACVHGQLVLPNAGHLPWDRWLAPFSTFVTTVLCLVLIVRYFSLRAGSRVPGMRSEGVVSLRPPI